MKKFLAAVLAVVLVLGLGTVAFAAGSPVQPDPDPYVPVVTPAPAEEEEETIDEALEDAAPEVSDVTAEEAVEAVDAETPVIVIASEDGFAATVDGEEVAVPVDAVKMISVAAAKEELEEEDYNQLVADVIAVAKAEEKGAIVSAFWFTVDEEIGGDAAKAINDADNEAGLTYTFACVGAPRVYLNGKLLEVTMNEDGTYTVVIAEAGSVVIVVDAAE